MKFEIENNLISWVEQGNLISVQLSGVDQALYSDQQKAVIVLAGPDQKTKKIYAFNSAGEALCEIEQPPETYFNGLGANRGHDVAIFATVYQIGWRDWWLSINCQTSQVESLGEGR